MRSYSAIILSFFLFPFAFAHSPIAQAQSPIAPQGMSPATERMPPRQTIQPASMTSTRNSQPAATLPPDAIRGARPLGLDRGENLIHFDPSSVDVRFEDRHYKLVAGRSLLKDFGASQRDAYEAKRLISDLRISEYGAIGTPEPVMEYWLTNGQPPPVTNLSRRMVPFDPTKLRVEPEGGAYYVRDARRVLFNFGPYAKDAEDAIRIIRKYEFNEIAYIGLPNPTVIYMLKNGTPSRQSPSQGDSFRPEYLPQHATRYPLDIPGLGIVGERRPIDAMRMEIQHAADGWHLTAGATDLGSVGNSDYQARTAMQIAQRYPFTEHVRVGTSNFTFFLSHNQAPREVPLGVRSISFQPKMLAAKQTGDAWTMSDGKQTLATFSTAAEAETAIKVIRYYKFDCTCFISSAIHYLAREH